MTQTNSEPGSRQAFASARTDGRKAVLLRVKTEESVRFVALPVKAAS